MSPARRAALLSFALLAAAAAPAPAAVEALSVAAPGFPTSFALDKFAARAAFLANKALGEGALGGSQAARELQLLLADARAELRGYGDDHWDKLPPEKQAVLRGLDQAVVRAQSAGTDRGRIENPVVLDLTPTLARLPFTATTPVLRRIEGATQYFRADGAYRLTITTNLPTTGATGYALTVAGQPAPADWMKVTPPATIALAIPAAALKDSFADRTLVHVPIEITAILPSPSWKFWQSSTYAGSYPFSLELLPKKPFGYALKEIAVGGVVDEKRTAVARGQPFTVPGCGAAGCEKDHTVCVDIPEGGKPVEAVNFVDRSPTDGTGSGWTTAVMPSANGICAMYKQRSPAQVRQVAFDVRYNPPSEERKETERKLKAQQPPDASGKPPPDADALELVTTYVGELSPKLQTWELTLKAFNGQLLTAGSGAPPSSPLLRVKAPERGADPARLTVSVRLPW